MKLYWFIQQDYFFGGADLICVELANELARLGYDVTAVFSSQKHDDSPFKLNTKLKIEYLNLPFSIIRADNESALKWKNKKNPFPVIGIWLKATWFFMFGKFKYRRRVKKMVGDNDLIIASSLDNYLMMPRNKNLIHHYHFNAKYFFSFGEKAARGFCVKPEKYVFLCKSTYGNVIDKKPKLKPKALYIDNPSRFKRVENFDNKDGRLLFVGRLVPQKRPLLMCEVANILKQEYNDFKLTFVGEGAYKEEMVKYIRDHDLEKNVEMIDRDNDLIKRYHDSDLLVMTSEFEGLPLSVIEAASQSTPTITLDWGDAVDDLIKDGESGYVIKDDNLKNMANCIRRLLEDDDELRKLKQNTYNFSRNYEMKTIIKKWEELLKENN